MLLQYNFQNSKIGQAKVNVIYSKNQTLSKVTIINGTRFRINYPYNIINNLTSNVLVIQKIKFGESNKLKSPVSILNGNAEPPSLGLNIRKVRVMSQSVDKKLQEKNKEKNNFFNPSSNNSKVININGNNTSNNRDDVINQYIGNRRSLQSERLNIKLARKKSHELSNNNNGKSNNAINGINGNESENNLNLNIKDYEKFEGEEANFNAVSIKNGNFHQENYYAPSGNTISNVVSPIMNMPLNITKSIILPSIVGKNTSSSNQVKNSNVNMNNGDSSSAENPHKDSLCSPGKIRMNFINRFRYNNEGNPNRPSFNGVNSTSNNNINININQTHDENSGNDFKPENSRYEGSPNIRKNGFDIKIEKNLMIHNNQNLKAYMVLYLLYPIN